MTSTTTETWTCPFCHKPHGRDRSGPITVALCGPQPTDQPEETS